MSAEFLRLIRFAASGIVSTVVYFVFLMLLLSGTSLTPEVASVAAYLGALFLSYMLQSRYTFRTNTDSAFQVGSFVAVAVAGLITSYLAMLILSVWYGFSPVLVGGLVCVLIPAMNYVLFKAVVFNHRRSSPSDIGP